MGQAVPTQHPAVVLRSHYQNLRAMLAVAMVAVIALTAVVVILATDDDSTSTNRAENVAVPDVVGRGANPATTINEARDLQAAERALQIRSEAMNDLRAARAADFATPQAGPAPVAGTRYDGGPEEGTRGIVQQPQSAPLGTRYDGGPEEGTRGPVANQSPLVSRYDGGPEEGSRGPGH